MERERFEGLVERAVEGLPEEFKENLENIVVFVEDWPTPEQLSEAGIKRRQDLLGLYEGIPLPDRGNGYNMVLPDRITIFQNPIELICSSDAGIVEKIQNTVRHEIAHYFGISDARLREIDRY
ncbi:MAG: metallopeptidase family protein [Dehalococcoidia bacterium]